MEFSPGKRRRGRSPRSMASRTARTEPDVNSLPTTTSTFDSTRGRSGTVENVFRLNSLGCWRITSFVWVGRGEGGREEQRHWTGGREQRGQVGRGVMDREAERRSDLAADPAMVLAEGRGFTEEEGEGGVYRELG